MQRSAAHNTAMFSHDGKKAFGFIIMELKYTAYKGISGMIMHLRSCTTVVEISEYDTEKLMSNFKMMNFHICRHTTSII
jgi:hypothetical protein